MRVAVYGSRPDGHARVVIELLLGGVSYETVGLIDDMPENRERALAGLSVIGSRESLAELAATGLQGVALGFGSAVGRGAVVEAIEAAGLKLPVLVHASAQIAASARLSPGAQVLALASVGPGARVGRGALINTGALVEHDVSVGDYAVIDPGAVLTGRASVGASVEIGSGAVVLPDVSIGEGALVGAGAVVRGDVPAGVTVAGVPARLLSRGPRL